MGAGLLLAALNAAAAPFPSTDQNPLLGGFSFSAPAHLPPPRQTAAQLTLNWSSTAALQQSGADTLIVDAESREWRLGIERAPNERLVLRAELPYRSTSAGMLDSAIERWHDFFGLLNGDRSQLQRDRLRIDYRRSGNVRLDHHDTSLSAVGDLTLSAGWQIQAKEKSATSVWSAITLPTGDADKLTGTDTVTGTMAIAHSFTAGKHFELFGHAGVHFSDSDKPLPEHRKSMRWLAMVGTDYRITRELTFTLQLDGHGAPFESTGMDLMGEALILTFGGDYVFPSKWRLQIGVAEDIQVEASPDVTFTMSVGKRW